MARARRPTEQAVSPRRAARESGLSGLDLESAALSWEAPTAAGRGPSIAVGPRRMNIDAIINLMAGAGGQYDKARATQWAFAATENWQALTNLYRASWLAKKIVTARNDDMIRGGVLLDWDKRDPAGKESDLLKRAMLRWRFWPRLRELLYYKSLYGGSILVLGLNGSGDKADLTKPLPIKDGAVDYSVIGKKGLRYLHVFDRWRAQSDGQLDTNVESPNAGRPLYHILTDIGQSELQGQRVHWSRVIRFDGNWVPWITWRSNAMWMDSELQVVLDTLKTYDSTTSAIASLIFEANIDVIKSTNLVKNLADADGEAAVQTRYLHAASQKSNYRMLLIDKDEEDYQRYPFQFSGLDKIWEKVMLDVAGATSYPVTRLFGQAPAGLNATGDADMRNYNADTAAKRESDLRPQMTTLLEVLAINEFGEIPQGFELTFPPLGEPTPIEASQIALNRAQRDKIYSVDIGAVTPGLIARELKEDGVFRTMEDADVALAEELDQPPPGGFEPTPGAPGSDPIKPAGAKLEQGDLPDAPDEGEADAA